MHTYIALFRGINVGGRNKLKMNSLVALLTELGYSDVKTYIQSGNVVLRHHAPLGDPEIAAIRQRISAEHQFEPRLMLLTHERFVQAAADNPYPTDDGKALHFYFLATPPAAPNLEKLTRLKRASEAFTIGNGVVYLFAPDGIGRSKLAAAVEQAMGVPTTARNWNTVRKLLVLSRDDVD